MTSVNDTIVLKGSVKINTYFMPIVGQCRTPQLLLMTAASCTTSPVSW